MPSEEMGTPQLERRVTRLEEGQAQLLSVTARIESMVESLAVNQKGAIDRINRPWQWGAVIAAFAAIVATAGIFATVLALTVDPIRENIEHLQQDHNEFHERIRANERASAIGERDRYWLQRRGDATHRETMHDEP
jgi:hypothetical protein